MKPCFSITAVVAMVLVCPATWASKPDPSEAPSDNINRTASIPNEILTKMILHFSCEEFVHFGLTNAAALERYEYHPELRFASKFADAVHRKGDPSDQVKKELILFECALGPLTKDPTVDVHMLIQAVGQRNLISRPKLASKFITALEAMKSPDGTTSPLHIAPKDYFFLLWLTEFTLNPITSAIGDNVKSNISNTLANSGLGIDSSWRTAMINWLLTIHLHRRTATDPPIRFSQGDHAALLCTIISGVLQRSEFESSLSLTPVIVGYILDAINIHTPSLMKAFGSLTSEQSIQLARDHTPPGPPPRRFAFTGLRQCLDAQTSPGAIFAGLQEILDSADAFSVSWETSALLKKLRKHWLLELIKRNGVDINGMWWLATFKLDVFDKLTIQAIYAHVFHGAYQTGGKVDFKFKDSNYFKTTGGGILGWRTQWWIVRNLVQQEWYSRAVDIFEYLCDQGFLPDDLVAQRTKIVDALSSWKLSKNEKLAQVQSMYRP